MKTFTFNGESSRDYGLIIEQIPVETGGQKIIESIQIPGRTGALTIDTGALANAARSYAVAFRSARIAQKMRDIRQWLGLSSGYCRLEDDYDPDVYRLARVINLPGFETVLNRYGRGELVFDCDPRRFLKEGERTLTGTIQNDWAPSKPIVIITAGGAGTAVVGNYTVTVTSDPGMDIYVNSETMEVHNGSTNLASYVSMTEFPVLEHGTNAVSYTGSVTGVSVIPNFWQP